MSTPKRETLPAIKLAEDILYLIYQSDVDVDDCNKASGALSQYDAGEGTLWGVMDLIERDGMDGKFFRLKGEVVDFIREIMRHENYFLVCGLAIQKNMEKTNVE